MTEIYRDRSDGAAARRQELLRRRREELVTMPHAVRRVVVARASRIAASMAATGAGVALLAVAWSPWLADRMERALPGLAAGRGTGMRHGMMGGPGFGPGMAGKHPGH